MLEGEIREINLLERLVELWREKFTGALRFENDGIIKILYFKGGDVLSASTNDRADSVDEILMRAGKVTRDHVKQALTKRKENETLGDALLNLGFITRKELTWGRRMQAISVIRSIEGWEAGSFTIVADYLPKREEGTIFPAPQLLTELIVTDQDRAKFERLLDSGSAVFAKMPGFDESFRSLGLNEDAEAVVRQVDGVRSAAEVVAISGQEAFNSYKLLHALTLLGLLHRLQGGAKPVGLTSSDDFGFETAGVSDAADAWSLPPLEPIEEVPVVAAPPPPPPEPPAAPPQPPSAAKLPQWSPPVKPARTIEEELPSLGFDEKQVEAARRTTLTGTAAIPDTPRVTPASRTISNTQAFKRSPLSPPKKKGGRTGLLFALLGLIVLAGAAYAGFLWWNAQQSAQVAAQPLQRRPRPVVPAPVPPPQSTGTIVEAPVTITPTTTESIAPVPPAVTSAAPVVAAPKPVPAPVVPPAGSTPAAARYDAMAREFLATAKGTYTVQFEILCDPSNVAKALEGGGSRVWFAPISLKGKSCYRLFWGNFDTREAAERAMGEIPAGLRGSKPAVVTIPR